ncbi:response regulator transcription factor (plasmid) [Agrobacterium sp. rho-13.3]|uniref:response regulator transcription factor n=1 Tax=Agrobacterium sp. rho-13.3 TaxID=3072980 RepID=UPI002A151D13|nr:helix-turn-helix transcriptional regulator [Agrobacterium sp. rho-13.3]MDX8310277.1 helix-turn-helix transcriptional regulator [Agrobacterium sp. rho-13.3]
MERLDAKHGIAFAKHLYSSRRTAMFPSALISSLQTIAPFEIFTVTLFSSNRPPIFLDGNLQDFVSQAIIDKFLSGTYLLDAVYTACCAKVLPGLYRLSELAPDNYFSSEFYNSSDFHPCVSEDAGSLAEEIVYMAQPIDNVYLVISLMRRNGMQAFDSIEFENLKLLEPVILETSVEHWRGESEKFLKPDLPKSESTLEKAFVTFAKEKLSPREQTIVSLLLRGHSTLSVAHNLDIAEGTAKVHRRNIYDKLRITSQAEMFLMFCSHVIDTK